jgi:hypothetical protein
MDTREKPDLRAIRGAEYDECFLREVDKGIAATGRGKFVQHIGVSKLIGERYPG